MSSKMITFCKNATCPSSTDLLRFQNSETSFTEGESIAKHLVLCEFCVAEVEFYAHYPQSEEEKIAKAEIPIPLFELASALLGNKHKDFSVLNQLLCQNEGVNI